MKLNLKEDIQKIIDDYKKNGEVKGEEIKGILEPYKTPSYASRFTKDGLQKQINEQMVSVIEDWKKYDVALNGQLKDVIAKAKKEVTKALGLYSSKRPDDYAQRISNAIEFVKIAMTTVPSGESLNTSAALELDNNLHFILKDFLGDYDTMKSFNKMVEVKIPTVIGYDGKTILPKTFGQFAKIETIMNTIDEMEAIAENIFLYKKRDGQEVYRFQGLSYAIPADGYSEEADEQNIIDVATIMDRLAGNIDSEGQGASVEE